MKLQYKTTFSLLSGDGTPPDAATVADECIRWALERAEAGLTVSSSADFEEADVAPGVRLATLSVEREDGVLWGLRLVNADDTEPALSWITEATVTGSSTAVFVTCVNGYSMVGGTHVPVRRGASRPRLVRNLARRWTPSRHTRLESTAQVLRDTEEDVDAFVSLLADPGRERPVVLVSCENDTDRPLIDPDQLADWLTTLAHVWVSENRFPSMKLRSRVPQRLNCWDGAVRLYWPRFSPAANEHDHPFWTRDRLRTLERRRFGFREHLLARVARTGVLFTDPREVRWSDVESAKRSKLREVAEERGDHHELLTMADADIAELNSKVSDLRAQLEELAREKENALSAQDYWRQQYEGLRRAAGTAPDSPEEEHLEFDDVPAAVEEAERRFEGKLAVCLNSKSDLKKCLYQEPLEVFRALEFLATIYRESRLGTGDGFEFDVGLRAACGWSYKGMHSEGTMKKYDTWYTTKRNGKKVWLDRHMGSGSGKEPRHTVRVAFGWDDADQIPVVGFIGQHQRTDAT